MLCPLSAFLCGPLHASAEQRRNDERRMKGHHDRRDQHWTPRSQSDASCRSDRATTFRQSLRVAQQHECNSTAWATVTGPSCRQTDRRPSGLTAAGAAPRSLVRSTSGTCDREETEHQRQQPQRRGEVRHRPHAHMQSADRMDSGAEHQANVLQIALAPALVALGKVDQRGRAFLVAALQIVRQADLEACPANQRRFDEVVAEDFAPQRSVARQLRQAAALVNASSANDRVVPPVVAVVAGPPGESFEKDRAVNRAPRTAGSGQTATRGSPARAALARCRSRDLAPSAAPVRRSSRRSSRCRHRARSCIGRRRPSARRNRRYCPTCGRRSSADADSRRGCRRSIARLSRAQATSSTSQTSGSVVSLSTKKSKAEPCPVVCSDSWIARTPANTRCGDSL